MLLLFHYSQHHNKIEHVNLFMIILYLEHCHLFFIEHIRLIETKSKKIDQIRIVTEKVQELLSAYDLGPK